MAEKQKAYNKSYRVILEPGTYWWCACGHSKTQPFCDGSHKKTEGIKPQKLVIEQKKVYKICGCKESKLGPICDNSHRDL